MAEGAFPAAVAEVGTSGDVLWREAFGTLSQDPDAPLTQDHTVFDLASLTKIIATTTFMMLLVEEGRLALTDPVRRHLREWHGVDREQVTIADLLAHSSGLTAYLPFYRDYKGRCEFQQAICAMPLEYPPRTQSIYSDLGFILLGFILEDVGRAPLAHQFVELWRRFDGDPDSSNSILCYNPPPELKSRTAPTEVDHWRGRLLVGEVHDENAWALGGAAGHSGLFGTAQAVGQFARAMLRTLIGGSDLAGVPPETVILFTTRQPVPNSSRALGWDTMLPTSSCGARMSSSAIGHTGFTGTSLWIDPVAELYAVLLTNRVYPSRSNEAIRYVRPAFHNAVIDAVSRAAGL